jgi:hypothetical protein
LDRPIFSKIDCQLPIAIITARPAKATLRPESVTTSRYSICASLVFSRLALGTGFVSDGDRGNLNKGPTVGGFKMALTTKILYESDFALWIEETVQGLRSGDLARVDLENLIEEVESLGRSERRELKARLTTLFEHALKRVYLDLPDCYRGWEATLIRTQRELMDILQDSPSLKPYFIEIAEDCYQFALRIVETEYGVNFPEDCPFDRSLRLLSENFWIRSTSEN